MFNSQLDRGNPRILSKLLGIKLIDRNAATNIRTIGLLGMRGRQEHRARTEMVGAHLGRRDRFRLPGIRPAYDCDVFAEGGQRLQRIGEVEIGAVFLRAPQV